MVTHRIATLIDVLRTAAGHVAAANAQHGDAVKRVRELMRIERAALERDVRELSADDRRALRLAVGKCTPAPPPDAGELVAALADLLNRHDAIPRSDDGRRGKARA